MPILQVFTPDQLLDEVDNDIQRNDIHEDALNIRNDVSAASMEIVGIEEPEFEPQGWHEAMTGPVAQDQTPPATSDEATTDPTPAATAAEPVDGVNQESQEPLSLVTIHDQHPNPKSSTFIAMDKGAAVLTKEFAKELQLSDKEAKEEAARKKAQKAFELRKSDLEEQIAQLSLGMEQHKAQAKALKKDYTHVVEQYQSHICKGPEVLPLFDQPQGKKSIVETVDGQSQSAATATVTTTEAASTANSRPPFSTGNAGSDAWRSVSVEKLDLKEKLIEKFQEAGINTIGELEDLRSQGNYKGKGLRSIKGIGEAKVTEIEDAVLSWLSANRDSMAFQSAAEQCEATKAAEAAAAAVDSSADPVAEAVATKIKEDQAGEPTTAEQEASEQAEADVEANEADNDDELSEEDLKTAWLSKPSVSRNALAQARCLEINSEASGLGRDPKDQATFDAGYKAYEDGSVEGDCPWAPGDYQDDWLRGFMQAEDDAEYLDAPVDDENEDVA